MRVWRHSSSKPDSSVAASALAAIVQQLGTAKFVDSLHETFSRMTGAVRASVFVYSRSCVPALVTLTASSATEEARYRDSFYKFDRAVFLKQREPSARVKHVLLYETDEIVQGDYRAAYEQARLCQRLSVLGSVTDKGWVSVNFYRGCASGAFSESQIEKVNDLADLVTVLAETHARLCGQPSGHSLQDYRHRLMNLAPRMTQRELDVCSLIAKGFTVPEISTELGVGLSTVVCYRRRGYARLGVANAKELLSSCF